MTEILHRYLMILLACISLLVGLQIPNFVDQYEKRIDAHLREVTFNLQPFQEIANKYFGGDMNKLIQLHRDSGQKPFQDEGVALEKMVQRKLRFTADLAALQASLPVKALTVLLHGDREMIDETLGQYSYAVPMSQDALLFGAGFSLITLLLVELLLALTRFIDSRLSSSLYSRPSSKAP
jgi:Protein of unknown function (DUF2937)